VKQDRLTLTPTILEDAKRFVSEVHRHHGPPVSHRFSVGCRDEAGTLRAVMVMGRPVARKTDQYAVLEVARVASDGCPNACSFLYGAACRIHRVHGFVFAQTFTLPTEPGTSLVAAGWKPVAITQSSKKGFDVPTRPRDSSKSPTGPKVRWECRCGPSEPIDVQKELAKGSLFEEAS
jgi:hypothetical protein